MLIEKLSLVNWRLVRDRVEKGKDVLEFIDHMILVTEKADTGMFIPEAMIGYDKSVKKRVVKKGVTEFAKAENILIDRHFSYVNTKAAAAQRAAAKNAGAGRANPGQPKGPCNHFNLASGCVYQRCRYRHCCKICYSTTHGQSECGPNVHNRSEEKSSKPVTSK